VYIIYNGVRIAQLQDNPMCLVAAFWVSLRIHKKKSVSSAPSWYEIHGDVFVVLIIGSTQGIHVGSNYTSK